MQITEIKVHLTNEERLKAFVSVTFDNCFAVRNMKVVEGKTGLILCMPSRKTADNEYKDLAHPITQEFRQYLETNVLQAYQEELAAQLPGKVTPHRRKRKRLLARYCHLLMRHQDMQYLTI